MCGRSSQKSVLDEVRRVTLGFSIACGFDLQAASPAHQKAEMIRRTAAVGKGGMNRCMRSQFHQEAHPI